MSSVAISGNASGAGVLTIAAPNTASSYTLTLPTQTGTIVSGSTTSNAVIPAGTTALAPILLTSGTNLTTATAGAIEYDGKVVYGTPIGTQRGIVPTQQYYRLNADLVGAVATTTTAQSIFGVGVTLSASTVYEIEMVVAFNKSAGATSHTFSIGFAGTATVNNMMYEAVATSNATSYATSTASFLQTLQTPASQQIFGAVASATYFNMIVVKGTVSINAGGTFIPQYTLTFTPGSVGPYSTAAGSYIRINPLSASGAATNVGTWA